MKKDVSVYSVKVWFTFRGRYMSEYFEDLHSAYAWLSKGDLDGIETIEVQYLPSDSLGLNYEECVYSVSLKPLYFIKLYEQSGQGLLF